MTKITHSSLMGYLFLTYDKVNFYSSYFQEVSTLTLSLTWPKVVCFVQKVLSLHMIEHQEHKFKIARLVLKVNIQHG